jgi:hypothetical protein
MTSEDMCELTKNLYSADKVDAALCRIRPGSKVKFIAHGETGLPYTVITREGDDCTLCDCRGRMLERVPFELLALVPGEPKPAAIRGVDELR